MRHLLQLQILQRQIIGAHKSPPSLGDEWYKQWNFWGDALYTPYRDRWSEL
ncbi:hypothetical protein LBWT_X2900 (plasmid) [Leptolyngbya boryana IAM M-101]|nr:hypothetical protein LBWT_X2900 [Leptolyngbya boryana IAM M-101]BAS66566.1 hypothetical protein LBDG_X2900 [Leptolyngbya boryana dg5]